MEMFKNLIGARLVKINDEGFTVELEDGSTRNFVFEEVEGDCCGYSEITTKLLIDENDLSIAPAITNVTFEGDGENEGDALRITLFGVNKPLATIDSFSSSGSGWCYGSAMIVRCKETDDEEIITEW